MSLRPEAIVKVIWAVGEDSKPMWFEASCKDGQAHTDYIRYIAIHPSLPYLLSSSDDMSIKRDAESFCRDVTP